MSERSATSARRAHRMAPSVPDAQIDAAMAALRRQQQSAAAQLEAAAAEPIAKIAKGRSADKSTQASAVATLAFSVAVLVALAAAWGIRGELHIVPETGIGYWLGIAGSLMMLVLMLYPLRKARPSMARLGRIASWFKMHMIFGILGPLLVVVHSNFKLKSANATVAMLTMLTVVASGIVGRYLYAKVHKGLYGKKAEVKALMQEAEALRLAFGEDGQEESEGQATLLEARQAILDPNLSVLSSLTLMVKLEVSTRSQRAALLDDAKTAIGARALREAWNRGTYAQRLEQVEIDLDRYLVTLRRAAELKFYSRVFAGWHVLHLPLFIMLILSALVHVIAVHLY